jgi:hypothetical protein
VGPGDRDAQFREIRGNHLADGLVVVDDQGFDVPKWRSWHAGC